MPLIVGEIKEHCLISLADSVFNSNKNGGHFFEIAAKLRFAKTILLLSEIMCVEKEEIRKTFFKDFHLKEIESIFK